MRSEEPEERLCALLHGVYDWSDGKGPRFEWGLCRQFSFYRANGEYDHMEQLRCTLYFEVTPELEAVGRASMWSDSDLGGWIAAVEQQEGFQTVMDVTPIESSVQQHEV